jgi:hypothetical protein
MFAHQPDLSTPCFVKHARFWILQKKEMAACLIIHAHQQRVRGNKVVFIANFHVFVAEGHRQQMVSND